MSIDNQSVAGAAAGLAGAAEAPAAIVEALLMPYLNQAARMFETGYASRARHGLVVDRHGRSPFG